MIASSIRHYLSIYRAQFRIALILQIQYRVAVAIWMIGLIVQPVVYLVVWVTVARAQGGSVAGLSVADFAAYYIVLMFLEHLTFTWIMWEFDYIIREGIMSSRLLRPIHPIHQDINDNITYKLVGLVMLIPAGIALVWAFKPQFNLELFNVVLFIPVLVLTFFLRFMLGYTLGMAAFWTNRISALNSVYFVIHLFFSGRLTPLELLPESLQLVANVLPFKWMVAYPIDLLLGRYSTGEALQGALIQLIWVVVVALMLRAVWQRGTRKYAAFGS